MKDPADQLWAYLHHELAPADKERFERALQNDSALRQTLNECRDTHKQLKGLQPILNSSTAPNRRLEKKLLAEWEAEHPEYAETSHGKPPSKILRFTLPLAAVAAAAAILLALPAPSIHWQRTLYGSAPQLRGQPAVPPHYTRTELKQVSRELQDAINKAGQPAAHWSLKINLQELADGALAVEVSGHTATVSKVWNQNFQGLEKFRQNIPRFGKQIADDLAKQDHP
ncbi:MAG: hypothetical protein WC047_05170 [Kiritimatiellales bacterium]